MPFHMVSVTLKRKGRTNHVYATDFIGSIKFTTVAIQYIAAVKENFNDLTGA